MSFWYERLKEIRTSYGYSQYELAEQIGVDETTISRYEKGKGSKKLTSNFRLKLKQVFTKDEVEYIEYGEKNSPAGVYQVLHGNNSSLAGRDNHKADSTVTMDAYSAAVVQAMSDLNDDEKLGVLSCIKEIKENRTKK